MKKIGAILFTILFYTSLTAQTVPSISTTIQSSRLEYSDKDIKEWEKFVSIRDTMYDNVSYEKRRLSDSDEDYLKLMAEKSGYDDEEFYSECPVPWETGDIGCSWYCGAQYDTKVSSVLKSQGKNTYSSEKIFDGNTRTAWIEGVNGYGIGEYIEFLFPYNAPRATTCYIANGYNKNEQTWRNNSRVKTFNVYEDDKLIASVHMQDSRNEQSFSLPYPIPNRPEGYDINNDDEVKTVSLKFVITEVYKGDKYDDTAISEFSFDGLDVHCLAAGTQILMANESMIAIENIEKGDEIIVFDTDSSQYITRKVIQKYSAIHARLYRVTLRDGSQLTLTDDHPILTTGGWKSLNPRKTKLYKRYQSVPVGGYQVGDRVLVYDTDARSSSPIVMIEGLTETVQTYTLELDGEGAYVGNFILVGQE